MPSGPSYDRLPPPSTFELGPAPLADPPPSFAIRVALWLRRSLLRLADALSPTDLVIFDRATGLAESALLGAVARHRIADLLEDRGPLRADAIAAERGLHADTVHRTLRALSSIGVFAMSSDGTFSNNRISRGLLSGRMTATRELALYFSSGSNAAAWTDYARTLETGESSFTRVHGKNVWDWFDDHPDEREMFAHCMMGMTTMAAPTIASLYPFREVKRVCDVGGGRGTLLSEIVIRHPHLEGVLCDREGVLASARDLLEARGVANRIELAVGSFFEAVPGGCDAYLMKNILHDWGDDTSKKILGVVRAAMKPGARLLLCEALVERTSRDALGTRADLQMLVACDGGRERSLDELRALMKSTGFRFTRVFPSATVSVVEGEAM